MLREGPCNELGLVEGCDLPRPNATGIGEKKQLKKMYFKLKKAVSKIYNSLCCNKRWKKAVASKLTVNTQAKGKDNI